MTYDFTLMDIWGGPLISANNDDAAEFLIQYMVSTFGEECYPCDKYGQPIPFDDINKARAFRVDERDAVGVAKDIFDMDYSFAASDQLLKEPK